MAEQFVSNSEEETEALGRRLGEILDQSTVCLLYTSRCV